MHIFYAVSRTPNAEALVNSNLWHLNLYPPLLELGHKVTIFDYDFTHHLNYYDSSLPAHREFIEKNRPVLEQRLLDQIRVVHKKAPIDLFFSYFYDVLATPTAIQEIRRMGIMTVNFYCNAVHQFHLIRDLVPVYDYCMVPEEEALSSYRAVGAKPIHIQMAANPEVYKPYPLKQRYPITFIGQRYLNRYDLMLYLYQHGIEVYIWGPNWRQPHMLTTTERFKRQFRPIKRTAEKLLLGKSNDRSVTDQLPFSRLGPALSDEALIKLYSESQISLGVSEVQDPFTGAIKRHIRLRDFEAPMSGAFYMTGYQDELRQYYEIDKEIICYDTPEELLDKVRFYLSHETEAQRIREAGRKRALKDHTWKNRFQQLFRAINIDSAKTKPVDTLLTQSV